MAVAIIAVVLACASVRAAEIGDNLYEGRAFDVDGDREPLVAMMRALGGDVLLAGTLAWSDTTLGWIGAWRLDMPGTSVRWQIGGVTFDEAFRNAMGGAAQVLSGNGQPE
jgi:hypothetical protein